jgi:hypothetical protein
MSMNNIEETLGRIEGLIYNKQAVNYEAIRANAAVAAMGGIISNPEISLNYTDNDDRVTRAVAEVAVKFADALVSELNKPKAE